MQLARLTRLESIGIRDQPTSSDLFAALPTLPLLHALHLCEMSGSADVNSILPVTLSACVHLIDLTIEVPKNGGSRLFRCIFCGPAAAGHAFLARLRQLYLGQFDLTSVRVEEFETVFASFTDLHQLTLCEVQNFGGLLPSIARAANLTDLTISVSSDRTMLSTAPSANGLRALMQANSSVTVTVEVSLSFESRVHEYGSLDPARFRLSMSQFDC